MPRGLWGAVSNFNDESWIACFIDHIYACRYEAAVEQLADAAIALDMGAYDESQVLVSAGQAEVRLCQKGCQDLPEHRSILMARNTEVDQLCNITLAIAKLIPR